MKSITPNELLQWQESGKPHQLIDIRELYEVETCQIGGEHIPMADVAARVSELRRDIPVVIHCKSGRRANAVIHNLEQKHGFDNLFQLEGGIMAWIEQIDPSMMRY